MRARSLSTKQRGVSKGIIIGMSISLCVFVASVLMHPVSSATHVTFAHRIYLAVNVAIAPVFCLALSIAALAKHRFFRPTDIDGSASSAGASEQAQILQSILQNTLEQTVLAAFVYLFWAMLMPARFLAVLCSAVLLFVLGRLLFALGYGKGAPARSLGFALTFFPTLLMLGGSLLAAGYQMLVALY